MLGRTLRGAGMTLLVSAAAGLVAAGIFAYVGYRLGHRVVTTPEARAAFTCFRVWWYAIALWTIVGPVRQLLFLNDALPNWAFQASANIAVVLLGVALWALLCNLVYVYTGSVRSWSPLAFVYFLAVASFLGIQAWIGPPMALGSNGWELVPATVNELPGWGSFVLLAALLGPPLLAAFAYLGLLRHAPGRTQRYRILMVAGSLIAWLGSALLATILGLEGAWGVMLPRAIGIAAALLALFAYDPPPFVQRKLGVQRAGEENAPPATPLSVSPPSPPTPPTPPATGTPPT